MDSSESNENHQIASNSNSHSNANDHGWQKVTYPKRQRKQRSAADSAANNSLPIANDSNKPNNVFRSLELQSEDRRRKILESQSAAADAAAVVDTRSRSKHHYRSDDDDEDYDSDDAGVSKENAKAEEKKVKQKKPKKPKVTVADATAKIDAADLAAFLSDISGSYEGQQEILLMRFADYFGRAFSAVNSSQFPWVKMFRENTVAKLADIPLSHISDAVYKTAADWINQLSIAALGSFVLWCLDSILADLASQQGSSKGSKKVTQQASSKSQVAMFVVLAMVLRRKPDALVNVLPTLRESSKYQGQDKLVVIVWMIAQASHGDLAVGLYSWAHNLLPIMSGKSSNPQSRDIILQLVEKILSAPKARSILVSGAVRKGERLMPPSALEILLRATFPPSSARIKATERFAAIYPSLKEVALAGASGSKAMKQVSQQILSFALKAAGESIPELSKEAAGISIWCLTENADCYKQWDKVYQDNLESSVAILRRLAEEWKELSVKMAPLDPLRETIKNFRQKNEKGMETEADAARQALFRDADKYSKALSGKLSHGHGCLKGMAVAIVALAAGAAVMSSNLESWDWKELPLFISSQFSF
uniref:Transmembrane protein 214-A n=1 Tax=Populus davidiana TaxID=266767 RepID=A0A6M2E9I3_9ROSI